MGKQFTEVRQAIPSDLLQMIGTYLSHRPYREVALMIQRIETEVTQVEVPAHQPESPA